MSFRPLARYEHSEESSFTLTSRLHLAPGSCNPLNHWWDKVAIVWRGNVHRLSCESQPQLCASLERLGIEAVPPSRDPRFLLFDGKRFDWYRGSPSPIALLDILKKSLSTDRGALGDSEASARLAAEQYLERREVMRTAEVLLRPDPDTGRLQRNQIKANKILTKYLEQWPNHINAIIMAAHAAPNSEMALSRWSQALFLEPQNARLHSGAAAVLIHSGDWGKAAWHLEKALEAPSGTHDAEDEEGQLKLKEMLRMIIEK